MTTYTLCQRNEKNMEAYQETFEQYQKSLEEYKKVEKTSVC